MVREVDCGCDRFCAVDYGVSAEEVGFSGCEVGCGHSCFISLFVYMIPAQQCGAISVTMKIGAESASNGNDAKIVSVLRAAIMAAIGFRSGCCGGL